MVGVEKPHITKRVMLGILGFASVCVSRNLLANVLSLSSCWYRSRWKDATDSGCLLMKSRFDIHGNSVCEIRMLLAMVIVRDYRCLLNKVMWKELCGVSDSIDIELKLNSWVSYKKRSSFSWGINPTSFFIRRKSA